MTRSKNVGATNAGPNSAQPAQTQLGRTLTATGSHLRIDGLSVSFPDRRVLTDVTFTASAGERIGLIGENGSGKSTLLRAIAGLIRPSAGTVAAQVPGVPSPRIGLLHQEPPFQQGETVAQALERAVAPARQAAQDVSVLGQGFAQRPDDDRLADAYSFALDNAERLGAWETDTRIGAMLSGLGLADIDEDRETRQLSGGQRARLSLAWLLLSMPDVLLLDEPTNHLDDAANGHLVTTLGSWRGPVIMASHDRAFLDEAATQIVDLDPSPIPHTVARPLVNDDPGGGIGVTRFTGNYSDYLKHRADTRARWMQKYRDEQAELKRLRAAVLDNHSVGHVGRGPKTEARAAKKFYADRNAKVVSRRVNDARSRYEDAEKNQVRKPPAQLEFQGLTAADQVSSGRSSGASFSGGSPEPVLIATNLAVDGRLAPTSLSVSRGEKWLLTGPNGSGKSTLLKVLAGRLQPTAGSLTRSERGRIGMLGQEVDVPGLAEGVPGLAESVPSLAEAGSDKSVLEFYTKAVGRDRASRVPLSTFGLIEGRDLNRPVRDLSVGQQRRLELAIVLANPPEILLLDEPTNHFSLSLASALEQSIPDYPGTVIVASHDRWLRKNWQGKHLQVGPHAHS